MIFISLKIGEKLESSVWNETNKSIPNCIAFNDSWIVGTSLITIDVLVLEWQFGDTFNNMIQFLMQE